MTITGAVRSEATDVEAVIAETAATRLTERGATHADDRTSEAAMEDRKREGYFSVSLARAARHRRLGRRRQVDGSAACSTTSSR